MQYRHNTPGHQQPPTQSLVMMEEGLHTMMGNSSTEGSNSTAARGLSDGSHSCGGGNSPREARHYQQQVLDEDDHHALFPHHATQPGALHHSTDPAWSSSSQTSPSGWMATLPLLGSISATGPSQQHVAMSTTNQPTTNQAATSLSHRPQPPASTTNQAATGLSPARQAVTAALQKVLVK